MVHRRQPCSNAAVSNTIAPSTSLRNCIRFSEARLQAVSSRNMYSEHGLEPRISPPAGQVCQSLMVEWNWMPGSAQAHAEEEVFSHRSRASTVFAIFFEPRNVRSQVLSSSTAFRNSSVTRTELFEFWPLTVRYASLS